MKVIIAPDSFTEFKSAKEIGNIIRKRYKKDSVVIPMADGGKGTSDCLIEAIGGKKNYLNVLDPLGRKIKSHYILLKDKTAFIEMANASGIELLKGKEKDERNPFLASTYGTGQLVKDALKKKNTKKIIIGIGGSATNDGGAGFLQALGVKFYDDKGEIKEEKNKGYGNSILKKIKKIDEKALKKYKKIKFVLACDVNNILLGKNGASAVYGPQKGASKNDIKKLDQNLKHYADIVEKRKKKKIRNIKGTGAAGGLPFSLIAFLNAKLERGVDIVAKQVNLEKHIKNADLVITGEGKIDKQSFMGKTIQGVAEIAKKHKVPVIAIGGCVINNFNKNTAKRYFKKIIDSSGGKRLTKSEIKKYGVKNIINATKEIEDYLIEHRKV